MSIGLILPWDRQPQIGEVTPAEGLGLTALILPGQTSRDMVSGVELSSVIGTPTRVAGAMGPVLQHNANREAIYTSATAAQKSPQGSIVWAGTLTGDPSVAACLGGTTFDASNSNPYVGLEVKRRVVSARTLAISFSYGSGSGQVRNLQTANAYTTGDVVVVGVFESGRQHIVVRSATGIEIASDTETGALSYGATARIEVGESLNSRNAAADTALLALSDQAWTLGQAMQIAGDVWGQLFQPRAIWVPVSAGGATTHDTAGALTGAGSTVAGSAAHIAVHGTSGALTGQGSVVAGASARTRAHPTSGALTGPGSVVDGSADHVVPGGDHDTSGALVGQGSIVDGAAARVAAPVTHDTSGELVGPGAVVSGQAQGSGEVIADTHDGFWSREWYRLKKREEKKPTIAEVVEIVKESPQVLEVVRTEVQRKYPKVDYAAVRENVQLQRFIAKQLIEAAEEEDDIEAMLLLA